ncbi:GrpB family protein [Bacillus sp. PK3_68]|uniref:GrpB family protein n=1 Tax=Bacillus sp. PK3_68 TaxID=2027408 RepID=UPI00217CE66F|nr:GrpB family protein [Bacillus sp. PK3_68]
MLNNIIGNQNIERINHIGSTSVNWLLAKPTIDILLEITEDCDLKFLVSVLEKNGVYC